MNRVGLQVMVQNWFMQSRVLMYQRLQLLLAVPMAQAIMVRGRAFALGFMTWPNAKVAVMVVNRVLSYG